MNNITFTQDTLGQRIEEARERAKLETGAGIDLISELQRHSRSSTLQRDTGFGLSLVEQLFVVKQRAVRPTTECAEQSRDIRDIFRASSRRR